MGENKTNTNVHEKTLVELKKGKAIDWYSVSCVNERGWQFGG